jgi:hypothetical protein
MEKGVQEALDFRRGGRGREQESKKEAHEQVPQTKPHVPVADISDDAHHDEERN